MIDVLHLIDTYRVGGPGKTIINSARFIDRSRYRVHVGSFTSLDPARNEFAKAVREAGIPYLELVETQRFNLSHVGQVRSYVKDQGIKVLHTHGYKTDILGYVSTGRLPVALVTTHHGWIRNTRSQRAFGRLALQFSTRFDGVEVVSRKLLDELPASLRRSNRAAVVWNGIVVDDYRSGGGREAFRREIGVAPDETLLGVIGRLSVEKGCYEMLDAFQLLAEKHSNLRLVFIGEGPIRADLEQRIRVPLIDARVSLLPHRRQIQPFYDAADVIVSPSRTEGLSNVILEALTVGRPIVATRVGGNEEIVEHEQTALLVEPQRPSELAAAIGRLLVDDALRCRLVANGRRRIEEEFTFEARMRKEERFYEDALARRGLWASDANSAS